MFHGELLVITTEYIYHKPYLLELLTNFAFVGYHPPRVPKCWNRFKFHWSKSFEKAMARYGQCRAGMIATTNDNNIWLVVAGTFFIFSYIGNNNPN